ncbi:MAG: hypothetical protein MK212_19875 [Saprospiraceae bacterium]|nr:hypothetical protein [Saprospiraceae bacterium]
MYFSGNLSVDPSQLTHIRKVKPQKAFKRMLYFMTFGTVSDRQEQETFTAISILQQLYNVFAGLGVNNLIRLSHDDVDFYLDNAGKHDDLKEALDKYDLEMNEAMSQQFEKIQMVLEHKNGSLHYLINITINRTHAVGAYPVDIHIDGLIDQFNHLSDQDQVKDAMQGIFKNQDTYNEFVLNKRTEFEKFLNDIRMQIQKIVQVDDIILECKNNIVLPKDKKEKNNYKNRNTWNREAYNPVYHGYYGTNDAFFYAWMWSDMCSTNHIHIHETSLVSESGDTVMDVGTDGFSADDNSFFDENTSYDDALSENNIGFDSDTGEYFDSSSSDSGGWFSGEDFGGGDSSCGSSCSSCGGCGGCGA